MVSRICELVRLLQPRTVDRTNDHAAGMRGRKEDHMTTHHTFSGALGLLALLLSLCAPGCESPLLAMEAGDICVSDEVAPEDWPDNACVNEMVLRLCSAVDRRVLDQQCDEFCIESDEIFIDGYCDTQSGRGFCQCVTETYDPRD